MCVLVLREAQAGRGSTSPNATPLSRLRS